jgi:hypothetical protein
VIVVDCVQGSQDWLDARAGACTASRFCDARERIGGLDQRQQRYVDFILDGMSKKEAVEAAGYKAAPTSDTVARALAGEIVKPSFGAKAINYAWLIALERIAHRPLDETFVTWQMRRGHDEEPYARAAYEVQVGAVVEESGICLTDDRCFGYSSDGFVGDDGMVEIKTPAAPEKVGMTWTAPSTVVEEYIDQIQGGLWITGRAWCDLIIWTPWLKSVGKSLYVQRFQRDEAYIEALEADLWEFAKKARGFELDLRRPMTDPSPPIDGDPVDAAPPVLSAVMSPPRTPNAKPALDLSTLVPADIF